MSDIIQQYSVSHFAVFPLQGKVPVKGMMAWQETPVRQDLTSSSFWPGDTPQGNYGVVVGPSRLVIDIDVRDGRKGIASFKQLCVDLALPAGFEKETFVVKTGSGGYHIYLKVDGAKKYRKTHTSYPNIEFLSGNAYVVGAGSIHPDTGFPYVVMSRSPNDLASAPASLCSLLEIEIPTATEGTANVEDDNPLNISRFIDILGNIPPSTEGNRSRAVYQAAAKGRDIGLSEKVCLEVMLEQFAPKLTPALSDDEFRLTIKNSYKYAQNPQGVRSISGIFSQIDEVESVDISKLLWDRKPGKDGEEGPYLKTLNNCVNHLISLCQGTFVFNTFTSKTEVTAKAPWLKTRGYSMPEVWDDDYTFCQYFLAVTAHLEYSLQQIMGAIVIAGRKRQYHPIHNYLNKLVWDGTPRIDTWLQKYAGVADNAYTRAVARKVLCGAVKRIMEPGCKFDHVLILEGPQGIGKSTLIRTIGKLWFAEIKFDPTKDMIHKMQGKWIIELTEMAGIRYAEMNAIKAFITIQKDTVRLSHARESKDIPRSSIFIGTINPSGGYLSDTENRRFWMVECTTMDIMGLEAVSDQLWAEAMQFYKEERLFLEGEAKERHVVESMARRPEEPYTDQVHKWIETHPTTDTVNATQILEWAGFHTNRITTGDLQRVGVLLHSMNWARRRVTANGTTETWYDRPLRDRVLREIGDL